MVIYSNGFELVKAEYVKETQSHMSVSSVAALAGSKSETTHCVLPVGTFAFQARRGSVLYVLQRDGKDMLTFEYVYNLPKALGLI